MVFTQGQENNSVNRGLQALPTNEITKLKLEGNIILNDFIFNTIDEYGVVWVITDIDGWWSSPDSEVEDIPRAAGDGNYDVSGRYSARTIDLSGTFLVPRPDLVEAARDRLVQACNLVYGGAWLKTGTNPVRASYVYMVGQIQVNTVNTRGKTEFTISLRASDPIKYEWNGEDPDGYNLVEIPVKNPALNYTGGQEILNLGNYPVPCFFEITGPFESPGTIFNRTTGELIVITQALRGTLSRVIVNKELSFDLPNLVDIATLTTTQKHGFSAGDSIFISGVGEGFDGDQVIKSIPTDTTFTYETSAATITPVAFKQITEDPDSPSQYLATLETVEDHGLTPGAEFIVDGVDGAFDGRYTVFAAPSPSRVVYSLNRTTSKNISSSVLVANIATISTVDPHRFIVGEEVTISGLGLNYDGTYEIVSIPDANSFSYAVTRTNSRSITNKQMTNDVVTLTTSQAHGFIRNEAVNVTNVNLSLNGGYIMDSVTADTFSYRRPRLTERTVASTAAFNGVVTLTTTADHGYAEGESVRISAIPGLLGPTGEEIAPSFFNGTGTITTLPSSVTFTYAQPSQFTVSNRSRTANVVTLTGVSSYPFAIGDSIFVSGVATGFNGTFTITSVALDGTSISYSNTAANVTSTASTGNIFVNLVATNVNSGRTRISSRKTALVERIGQKLVITTETSHGAIFGENITLSDAGANFNGSYTISAIPLLNVLEVDNVGDNVLVDTSREITKVRRNSSAVARVTYARGDKPRYEVSSTTGHKIKVSGVGSDFDGVFTVTTVGNDGVNSWIEYSQPGKPTVAEFETDGEVVKDYGYLSMSGTITSSAVAPAGQARVAGTLPFTAAIGTAVVSPLIERQQSGGNAIEENNVQFTPGLSGATGVIDADVLEIDTKNREVAFNGEVEGARGRIDVLADFIKLAPGQNEIEFVDTGNPEGSALLKVFYRSGWLA
jgi:hypothetical protein